MHIQYMFVSPTYFESVNQYSSDGCWYDLIRENLEGDWDIQRWSYWIIAHPSEILMPDQGFKIHISPDYERIEDELVRSVKILSKYRCSFKVVADKKLLGVMNSKSFSRTASGKFITIYPNSHADFLKITQELSNTLKDFKGPYILTDKRVPDSEVVYYRYGGFRRIEMVTDEDLVQNAIKDVQGNYIPDKRLPFFHLPQGVDDPFLRKEELTKEKEFDSTLGGKYKIKSAIAFSNGGGIYKGEEILSGREVLIKEARPYAGIRDPDHIIYDSVSAIKSESDVLEHLRGVNGIVEKIDLLQVWENWYLIESLHDATTWYSYFARDEYLLLPFVPGHTNVKSFLHAIIPLLRQVVDIFVEVHKRSILLGDVSPNNILIDANNQVTIIDFESSILVNDFDIEPWKQNWLTPGFAKRKSSPNKLDSDWHSLAMCVAEAALPIAKLASIKKMDYAYVSDLVTTQCGLPIQFRELLIALFEGNVDATKEKLDYFDDAFTNHGGMIRESLYAAQRTASLRAWNSEKYKVITNSYLENIGLQISNTYREDCNDFYWPSDANVFLTNKLNICWLSLECCG